jgi:hypothetical protein
VRKVSGRIGTLVDRLGHGSVDPTQVHAEIQDFTLGELRALAREAVLRGGIFAMLLDFVRSEIQGRLRTQPVSTHRNAERPQEKPREGAVKQPRGRAALYALAAKARKQRPESNA